MDDSVFTKIIKGELPCHKVYEDELTLALLDIYSPVEAKTLVISKKQVDHFVDLPDEDYLAVWQTVKKVSLRLKEVTGKDRVGVMVEGTDVPHTHIHLIPFDAEEDFLSKSSKSIQDPDHDKLSKIAEKLRFS